MTTFYMVGGSVRDKFLGVKSKDVDYAVEAASFEAMRESILARGGDIFLETPKYFTIRARVPALGACDFVLCRKDGAYNDGRRPDSVEVGTIYDDLARRDFTANAIAIRESDGQVIDPHNGVDSITDRTLHCVGDARTRFTEDGLRILRAIRFSITKPFNLDDTIYTLLGAHSTFCIEQLRGVSPERIREELVQCFACDTYSTLLALMDDFPELGRFLLNNPKSGMWLKPTLEAP